MSPLRKAFLCWLVLLLIGAMLILLEGLCH